MRRYKSADQIRAELTPQLPLDLKVGIINSPEGSKELEKAYFNRDGYTQIKLLQFGEGADPLKKCLIEVAPAAHPPVKLRATLVLPGARFEPMGIYVYSVEE